MAEAIAPRDGEVKKTLGFLTILAIVIGILFAAGLGMYYVMGSTSPKVKKIVVKDIPEIGPVKSLGEFVLNLADAGDPPRYIKLSVSLELKKDAGLSLPNGAEGDVSKIMDELKKREAQLKDIIVTVISGKVSSELATIEGKEAVKRELKQKISAVLTTTEVSNVFFETFAIQ